MSLFECLWQSCTSLRTLNDGQQPNVLCNVCSTAVKISLPCGSISITDGLKTKHEFLSLNSDNKVSSCATGSFPIKSMSDYWSSPGMVQWKLNESVRLKVKKIKHLSKLFLSATNAANIHGLIFCVSILTLPNCSCLPRLHNAPVFLLSRRGQLCCAWVTCFAPSIHQ